MRILLVRDKDFFIYIHQLAFLLTRQGHHVEVLYTYRGEIEPLYSTLIDQVRDHGVICHLIKDSPGWLKRKVTALLYRLRIISKTVTISKYKIRRAKRLIADCKAFDYVITFDPPALFLAAQVFPGLLGKFIHFSLEVIDESHPDFRGSRVTKALRLYERKCLARVRALMIQDRFREGLLKARVSTDLDIRTIYYPVALAGGPYIGTSKATVGWQQNVSDKKVTMFFGGLWDEDMIRQLSRISVRLKKGQVIVVQGGRGCIKLPATTDNFVVSTEQIPFDRINDVIASAHIGLALYPSNDLNSRYTAFSSEKIARYAQCGIPFIAFDNEDYRYLKKRFNCCELINSYEQIPDAIEKIYARYNEYVIAVNAAFEHYYSLDWTSREFLDFIATES